MVHRNQKRTQNSEERIDNQFELLSATVPLGDRLDAFSCPLTALTQDLMKFSSLVLMMLLVRGECDPSRSRGVWRRHVSWAVLLGPANASPVLSVSSKRAPRFEISRQVVSYKSFFDRSAPGHLRTANRAFVSDPTRE